MRAVDQLGDAEADALGAADGATDALGAADGATVPLGLGAVDGLGDGWHSFSGFVSSPYRA